MNPELQLLTRWILGHTPETRKSLQDMAGSSLYLHSTYSDLPLSKGPLR